VLKAVEGGGGSLFVDSESLGFSVIEMHRSLNLSHLVLLPVVMSVWSRFLGWKLSLRHLTSVVRWARVDPVVFHQVTVLIPRSYIT
jgi:hypothetical protein